VVDINEIKTKKQGKHKTQRVPDIDFKNKRNDRLLSRMVRNRHHNREKPIPIIDVEDRIFVDDTSVDLPQYDFVSNLPPFLKEQEGFWVFSMISKGLWNRVNLLLQIKLVHCQI
jgi:hypothetical protein